MSLSQAASSSGDGPEVSASLNIVGPLISSRFPTSDVHMLAPHSRLYFKMSRTCSMVVRVSAFAKMMNTGSGEKSHGDQEEKHLRHAW